MILRSNPVRRGLNGTVRVPGDKSISHRAVILASLADGKSRIRGFLKAADTMGTLSVCRQLGVEITETDDLITVQGVGLRGLKAPAKALDLGNSGTAMRLLAGVLAAQSFESRLTGDSSLSGRPMGRILKPLKSMGAVIESSAGCPPLLIKGGQSLGPISYRSPVASAQVKSCLLLAALCAGQPAELYEPQPSRDHTERLLQAMGAGLEVDQLTVKLKPTRTLAAIDIEIPADPSSAAFACIAGCLVPGSDISLPGVGLNSSRDGVFRVLGKMAGRVTMQDWRNQGGEPVADLRVRGGRLQGVAIPESWVPKTIDEFPVLMAAAAVAKGITRIRGAAELRVKESDRLQVMTAALRSLGVEVSEYQDGVDIQGGGINGGEVDAGHDHRCAMSLLVLGLVAAGPVVVSGCDMIATSYPEFVQQLNELGADIQPAGSA